MFYLKIHAANIEASKFFVFVLSVTMENFPKCNVYVIVTTFIYFSESRVARNTILIQRDDCGLERFNDGPCSAVMKEEDL